MAAYHFFNKRRGIDEIADSADVSSILFSNVLNTNTSYH